MMGFSFFRLGVAAAIALAVLGAAWKWRHGGVVQGRAEVQALWEADIARRTAAQLAATEKNRVKENALNLALNQLRSRHVKDLARRDATATAVADSLREFAASAQPGKSGYAAGDPASTHGVDDSDRAIADQCAAALGAMDGYAAGLASKVTGLQAYVADVCWGAGK